MKNHVVEIMMGANAANLHESARRILSKVNLQPLRFKETYGANASYDFFWEARRGDTTYRVAGDSWEKEEIQNRCSVTISGPMAFQKANELLSALTEAGWRAQLLTGSERRRA